MATTASLYAMALLGIPLRADDQPPVRLDAAWRPSDAAPPTTVRRRFRCREAQRDVEVEFVARGVPGLRTITGVRSCPVFDPSEAVACARGCTSVQFRRADWEWPLPLKRHS